MSKLAQLTLVCLLLCLTILLSYTSYAEDGLMELSATADVRLLRTNSNGQGLRLSFSDYNDIVSADRWYGAFGNNVIKFDLSTVPFTIDKARLWLWEDPTTENDLNEGLSTVPYNIWMYYAAYDGETANAWDEI